MDQDRFDRFARRFAVAVRRRSVVGAAIKLSAALPVVAGLAGRRGDAVAKCKTKSEREVKKRIRKAAKRYKQDYKAMLCVAKCESVLDNCAVNAAGKSYGLFQFINPTWARTPYADKDIFSAKWNALATGWMWKQGYQNEWVCCDKRYGCGC